MGLIFHGLIPSAVTCPITVAALTFHLERDDPTYHIYRHVTFLPPYLQLSVRVATMFFTCLQCVTVLFLSTIFCLTIVEAFLTCQTTLVSSSTKNLFNFDTDFAKYRQLTILAKVTNDIMYYPIPVAFLTILLCCIVCGHMLLKLTGVVPIELTLLAGIVLTILILILLYVVRQFGDVFYQSSDIIRAWKLRAAGESKCRTRQVQSCRKVTIEVGPFFFVRKETTLKMISEIAYYTISLVISV